ncbi:unnamed protein product [Boreogadus saida]
MENFLRLVPEYGYGGFGGGCVSARLCLTGIAGDVAHIVPSEGLESLPDCGGGAASGLQGEYGAPGLLGQGLRGRKTLSASQRERRKTRRWTD